MFRLSKTQTMMKRKLYIILALLLLSSELMASHEIMSSHRRGSNIAVNGIMMVEMPDYNSAEWAVRSSDIFVRLYLAEDRERVHNTNQQYCIHYTIDCADFGNTHYVYNDSVIVDYSTTFGYKDVSVCKYTNYRMANLMITSISGDLSDDIILELGIEVTRYSLSSTLPASSFVNGNYQTGTNELLLSWGYVGGADEYDVEWLFVDNPSHSSSVAYDFANATRVTTSNNHYHVPLAYSEGTILYRVRPRGTYVSNNVEYPVFGNWSYTPSKGDSLPSPSFTCRYDYCGLEDSLTWQYTAVYAEEGKRKEVITFYDGTLRNRQEVTINNTDKVAIVGETFYDHVGRQALQSIPAPTPSRGVRYYGTGNSSNGLFNGDFEKADYDYDTTLTHALPFPANAGSAVYHSSANPFLNNPHWINIAQTPADSGYTYSHTRYLNDGTDRVHSQSAPGEAFKMGGGRETRFYYGNPMQVELDRLFGNEVGDASHYQKVVTVDANGENTVSYYDMKERLIVSAIIPSSNTNLLPVDNTPVIESLNETHAFDENSRSYTQSIVVATPTNYNFTYHVKTANALCDTCNETSACIGCRYRVVFSLWNPDVLEYVFKDSLIISENTTLQQNNVFLNPGSYQLYKSIAVIDDDETDIAYEAYSWRQRPCIHFKGANIAHCYTPCEEFAMDSLELDKPDISNEEYVRLVQDCENPPQNPNTECEAKRRAMLADMSPGGQYFDYKLTCCPADSCTGFCESGLNNSFLTTICRHRLLEDGELRDLAHSFHTSVTSSLFWDSLRINWQPEYAEVMLKYHPEYHLFQAECECGNATEQYLFDSIFFNTNTFDQAEILGLLNPLGLDMNENTEITFDPRDGYQPFGYAYLDPFFQKEFSCCQDKYEEIYEYIRNRMLSYMSWRDGEEEYHISVWWLLFDPNDIAHGGYTPGCEEITGVMQAFQDSVVKIWAQGYNCSENDARWLLFKSIYLYLKEEIRQTILPACLLSCDIGEICDIGDGVCCNCPSLQWGQFEWWSKQFDISALDHCAYYLKADTGCSAIPLTPNADPNCEGGFQIRFICNPVYGLNVDNFMASRDSLLQLSYEDCCADCEAHANGWMEELHDYLITHCPDTSLWMTIRQKLIDICKTSCDESLQNANFTVEQRIDLEQFEELLENNCSVISANDYPRIIYPRPTDYYTDCGCQNYQNALHSHGLTFWDEPGDTKAALANEGIFVYEDDIDTWNHFCIWQLYDNMLRNIDDTTALYDAHFPEQFRCEPELSELELCQQQAILAAAAQDTITFYHILDSMVMVHRAMYEPHCMSGLADTLRISCHSQEFLYTLYYYDQADNLIKTIPPKGVHPIQSQATLDSVSLYRHNISRYDTLLPGFIHPQHTMATNYKYNTLNQITVSYQPDHDSVAVTYYDILSRPVLSQNGKQKAEDKYSYTLYDSIGRIVEVGQVVNSSGISQAEAANPAVIDTFIANGAKTEITHTYYDKPLLNTAGGNNLRNRIAAVAFYPQYPLDSFAYQAATHYSYDIHGNVKQLVQDIPALITYSRKLTYIDYEYDLVSGNVNKVWFQKGKPEQFMHRYRYDADNRLTHVYTSATTPIKIHIPYHQQRQEYFVSERLETRYFYLPNGMLSRVELGQKNVQGTDYAYTLQGWLKDINGYRIAEGLTAAYDIGHDGQLNTATVNSEFCRDAFSSMLQYYHGDYRPISSANSYNNEYSAAVSLYNGNISALTTDYLRTEITPLAKFFRYDKLNRIKHMETCIPNSSPIWLCVTNQYETGYCYDHNGNILSLQRYDDNANIMHDISYQYSVDRNRLNAITATGLNSSTYRYDAIGNLTQDTGVGLEISWNAAGKVDTIWKNDSVLSTFSYSATGQRQIKKTGKITDYYIHDASGNIMCIYRQSLYSLETIERPIYGNKRLGIIRQPVDLFSSGDSFIPNSTIGMRQYELTDHLGNVMATILDRRQPYSTGDSTYKPYVISTTDYYPFGYPISNRSTNIGGYRYFFNGQEGDNEVLGDLANFGYEFRQYDSRLGRWWSVDPKWNEYPSVSPFVFCNGSPIMLMDPDGEENLYAFHYAQRKLLNKVESVRDITTDSWYGYNPGQHKTLTEQDPQRESCFGIVWHAYMKSGGEITSYLQTGFSDKNNSFNGRNIAKRWFKEGNKTSHENPNDLSRSFETDIMKGEIGDIVFMSGHAAMLAELPEQFERDGMSFVKMKVYTTTTYEGFIEETITFSLDNKNVTSGWSDFEGYGQLHHSQGKGNPELEQ